MLRELLDCELEKIELVSVKRIQSAKLIAAAPAVQINGIIAESVEGLKVIFLAVVDVGKHFGLSLLFGEEPLLYHFPNVRTGESQPCLEPAHNLGQVLSLHAPERSEDAFK